MKRPCCSCRWPRCAPPSKPAGNILILLADDMGYGDPGCYNPKSKIATPTLTDWPGKGCGSPMPMRPARCVIPRATGC
jgi:hypothetical protein